MCLQSNFEEQLRNVLRFHASLDEHVHWLGSTETALSGFRRPSKLVDRVEQQIARHKVKAAACWFTCFVLVTLGVLRAFARTQFVT